MRFLADLHLHSRFSRATSADLALTSLHAWAQRKGLFLLGTGDVTHPEWLEELATQLEPAGEGLYRLRPELAQEADRAVPAACRGDVRFLLQGEVSSIYKHDGAVRKVHNLVYLPDLPAARRFLAALDRLGNVRSDGRPILGLPSRDLLEVLLDADPRARLVPAHVWTPWFSLLGSKSGYDSVGACFGDLAGEIPALETGLSSDPVMNGRVSSLDPYGLISNSDAHSAPNLGREANEFDLEPGFEALFASLRPGDPRFRGTVEFFPEEGKYHLDGHRACGVRLSPRETREAGGRCPACGGKLTVGVLHRVEELADRPEGGRPPGARSFTSLVPLAEVVAECAGVGRQSRRVQGVLDRLAAALGPEFAVLREAPLEEIERVAGPLVAEGVRRVREGRLHIAAGYDGEFGTVKLFAPEERRELGGQGGLFAMPAAPEPAPPPGAPPHPSPPPGGRRPGGPAPAPLCPPTPPPLVGGGGGEGLGRGEGEARTGKPAARTLPLFGAPDAAADLLAGLDPEQREAVLAPPGPLAIVAGPGTGKTRTLTCRIAHRILAGGVAPERVLAVTFTNRAAAELRERLAGLLGSGRGLAVRVSTLHRLGLDLLRADAGAAGLPPDFPVLGEAEALELLAAAAVVPAREAARLWDAVAAARRGAPVPPEAAQVAAGYEAALARAGAVDLDGLILRPVRLLEADPGVRSRWQGRFDHLAVDEFQDLDPLQHRLVELLAPGSADVTAIGDPDQSIYGFRGAAPGLFAAFAATRPGFRRVRLGRNYRSTETILRASAGVLAAAGPALGASTPGGSPVGLAALRATIPGGDPVGLAALATERAEAEFVAREIEAAVGGTSHLSRSSGRAGPGDGGGFAFGEIAVLHRLRAQRPALEEALLAAGIPFRAVGEEPALLRGQGAEVLRRLRGAPRDQQASGAVAGVLAALGLAPDHSAAGAWHAAAAGAETVGECLDQVALRTPEDDFNPRAERVTLMTLHAAKGLEFPVVFVTGCEDGLLPHRREGEEPDPEEERRLLYVGTTRAKARLVLTRARRRLLFGRVEERSPSPFLAGIDPSLTEARGLPDREPPPRDRQLALF